MSSVSVSTPRSARSTRLSRYARPLAVGTGLLCLAAAAVAGGGGFDQALGPLQKAVDFASGPLARLVGAAAIIFAAYQYIEGKAQGMSKPIVICVALGVIIGVTNIIGMFGFSQGALI